MVDIRKWNKRRNMWERLLTLSLGQEDDEVQPSDPFQALKNAELAAEAISYKLAPRSAPSVQERFAEPYGSQHQELHLLRAARVLVVQVLRR